MRLIERAILFALRLALACIGVALVFAMALVLCVGVTLCGLLRLIGVTMIALHPSAPAPGQKVADER